jgi:hypothetical protein
MQKTIFGTRKEKPAFFDMACRFKLPTGKISGTGFRIGDRAMTHVWLGDWRLRNRNRRLLVLDDIHWADTEYSRYLPAWWLFKDIADEIWVMDSVAEQVQRPAGDRLYHTDGWRIWKWVRKNAKFKPTIRPLPEAYDSVKLKMASLGIPEKFITVQPLFDAAYGLFRNSEPSWWRDVCSHLSSEFAVVILGAAKNAKVMTSPPRTYPLWEVGIDPMESLAVISMAQAHVGGETGTSLWAPIFGTPIVAVYKAWDEYVKGWTDTRPMSFGSPVIRCPLNSAPGDVVKYVELALKPVGPRLQPR